MDSNEVRKEIKALVENGKRSFDERKFGDALSAFSRAIPKDPNNYLFYLSRGFFFFFLSLFRPFLNSFLIIK